MSAAVRPPVTFPDAVDLTLQWLRPALPATVPAVSRVPNPRPAEFVRVARVGGVADGVVDVPRLVVECWAQTAQQAHDTCQTVRRRLALIAGQVVDGHQIYRCDEAAGPASLPDEASDQERYTMTVTLRVRGDG